jgi:hypothetical protein
VSTPREPDLRVARGRLTAEETAALTVAILAAVRRAEAPSQGLLPDPARWFRLERSMAFRPGHSWQLAR